MRKKVFFVAVLLVTMLSAVVGWAADWFVRPAGGDYGNEDGTSYENAWDGFENIDWSKIQPGDTLFLSGTFNLGGSGRLVIKQENILVTSYEDRAKITNGENGIYVRRAYSALGNNVTIKNIEICNTTNRGINIEGFDGIKLIDLYIHNTGSHGVDIEPYNDDYCDNITIQNCIFSHCGDGSSNARALWGSVGTNCLVKNCVFEYCDANGSSLCVGPSGSSLTFDRCVSRFNAGHGWGVASNISSGATLRLVHCKAYNNNGAGAFFHGDYQSEFYVEYCLFFNNGERGIARAPDSKCNLHILNCTITGNKLMGIRIESDASVEFKNNIVAGNGETGQYEIQWEDTDQTIDSDYNCIPNDVTWPIYSLSSSTVYTLAEWSNHSGQDAHSLDQNPLLTSNYHLSRNSPCIDVGIKLPIHDENWRDLAGNRIRYGTAPDIGCYEYKTWPRGAWGMLPWIGGRHKVQWTPYE